MRKLLLLGALLLAARPTAAQDLAAAPGGDRSTLAPWTELEAGFNPERLDNGQPDWSETWASLAHRDGGGRVWIGRLAYVRRFDKEDVSGLATAYLPVGKRVVLLVEGGGSPSHEFLARWTGMTQLQLVLGRGFGLLVGARRTSWGSSRVDAFYLGAEKYIGNFRFAYTFSPTRSNVAGDGYGHLVQVGWFYGERSRVTLAYGHGKETYRPDLGVASASQTDGLAVFGRQMLSSRLGLGYSVSWTRQQALYDREGVSLALSYHF